MKNSLGKKALSILISAIMVISMIPTFAITAFAEDAAVTAINAAISAYEAKMNGTVYTNMGAAYTAYVNANKAKDSYLYGDSRNTLTASDLSTIASTLTNATNAMTAWSAHSGSANAYLCTIATGANGNILFSTPEGKDNHAFSASYTEIGDTANFGITQRKTYYKAAAPSNVVMYYNGNLNDLYFPVAFEAYASNDRNRTIQYVDLNGDANLEVTRNWYGYQQGWDGTYGLIYDNAASNPGGNDKNYGDICGVGYSSSNTLEHKLSKDGNSKNRFWVNIAHVKALSNNTLNKSGITLRMKTDYGTGNASNSSKIYVVNYYQLTQAINSNKNKFNNVASYKQGGLNAVFAEYDKATSFNLTQYKSGATAGNGYTDGTVTAISDSNAEDYYNYAQNFCTYHATQLDSLSAGSTDTDYSALRNAITYEGVIAKLGDGITHSVREMAAVENGADIYSNYDAFIGAYNAAIGHMAALYGGNYYGGSTSSDLATALINAFNNLGISGAVEPSISGDSIFIGKDEMITITNNDTNGAEVSYTIAYDGEDTPSVSASFSAASKTISVFGGLTEQGTAVITAWSTLGASVSSSVEKTFINEDYESASLIYRESFDGASVSGTNFTTGSEKGLNATLANSGSATIEASAGADYDKRSNVLKINASTLNTRGNYIQLAKNPLSNSVAAAYAKQNGVTVSFWRKHNAANSGRWLNALSFTSYDSSHEENRFKYLSLTSTAAFTFVQRDNDNGGATGGGWMDYFPNECDISNHSASVDEGYWANIVLTVNPKETNLKDAVIMYINGEPHDVDASSLAEVTRAKAGSFESMTDSEVVATLLDFLTDKNTHFDFAYSGYGDVHIDKDLWLDDIRIYTEPLTQVAINNMYTDALNDAKAAGVDYQSSTSHDPTNVIVYTLKSAVATDNGVKAAGSQVGQEFIDYYNVPESNYTVDYYSFGTGLTIYHSTDNLNWTVLGDSMGRCGYQNQELFVSDTGEAQPYYITLADTLEWAAQDTTSDARPGAAGKLVWAPHVMYNLTTDKWMYYGSTSSWNSAYSTVFLLTSDSVASGYKYVETIVKSQPEDGTNAIDSCVYYGHNSDGAINKNELYCLYGSWSDVRVKTLNANGTRSDGERDLGTILSIAHGGGEGGYMIYKDGYYYYFITCEANGWAGGGGNYHTRVFRSENPTSGFVSVAGTAATTEDDPHGNAFYTAHENAASDYRYTSTGHNSVYSAYNDYGEEIYINAAHTREYSKDNKPVEDGQLATRQIWLIGNVAIQNPVAFTSDGWPTAFPKLYDNSFSLHYKGKESGSRNYFNAYDIDGAYSANSLSENGSLANEAEFKIFALNSTMGVIVDGNTLESHLFSLENTDDATYIHLFDDDGTKYGEGVIANQGENGEAVPMFSYIIEKAPDYAHHVWGIKTEENKPIDEIQTDIENITDDNATVNGKAYYEGTETVNADGSKPYSNVVYTSATGRGDTLDKAWMNVTVGMPENTVLVYDGVSSHQPSLPVVISTQAGDASKNPEIRYISNETSGFALNKNWSGYVSESTVWPKSVAETDKAGYNSEELSKEHTTNDIRYWSNQLFYTGTGNISTYYDIADNVQFHYYGRYPDPTWGFLGTKTNEDAALTAKEGTKIYVINYKPIYDILMGTTKLPGTNLTYSEVYDDVKAGKYTATSTMAYYRAMELVAASDPESYDYTANCGANVKECADNIKLAVGVFNSINLQEKADFTELDAAYAQADELLMAMNGNIQPIYTEASVNALKNAAEAAQSTVSLNAEERADTAKTEQNSIDTKAQAILDAIENLENAQTDEIETYQELVKTTTLAVDRDAYDISQSDLDDAVAVATDSISETVTYTSADGTESTIKVVNNNSDSENVEGATSAIMSTLTTNTKKYEITLVGDNSEIIGFSGNGWAGKVGEKQYATFNSVVNFESDDENTAWSMEYKSSTVQRGKQYQSYGKNYSTRVLGDLKVWAVNAETNEEKPYKVSIQRVYSDKEGVFPVQSIDFTGSEFTLPDAPVILGYTFNGYTLDQGGENVTINGNTVSGIDKDIQIAANYTRNEGEELYSVKVIGTDNVTEIYNETHLYNDKVTVDVSNAYAYVERIGNSDKYRPYFICPEGTTELSFFVSESIELRAVNASQYAALELTTLPAININQSESRTVDNGGKNKTYFNGQVVPSVSSDIQIVEYGFLVGIEKTADKLNAEDVVIEKSGDSEDYRIIRAKSTKDVGAHQFTIAVNGLSGKVIYRGYIKYQSTGGNIETVYTDTQTVNI